tara:strand:+ start:196 stop:2259 length:2064 start_codon:yes stop_codon:yes gene_type:complete
MKKQEVEQLIATYSSGNLYKAEQEAKKLIQINPNNAVLPNILGACLFARGQIHDAVNSYKNAIDISPEYVEAHSNLGVAYLALNDFESAITSLERAIKLNPKHSNSYNNLGLLYVKINKINLADVNFKKAIEIDPTHAQAYKNLGDLQLSSRNYEGAIISYNSTVNLNPNQWETYNNLGLALTSTGLIQEAIKAFEKSLDKNPKSSETLNNLGTAYAKISRSQKAIQCFREALTINPTYKQAYTNLGTALLNIGQIDEAEECYIQALKVEPNHSQAHFALGNLLRKRNQTHDAAKSYKKAVEVNPKYYQAHNNLGNLYTSIGNFKEAHESYEEALRIRPNYALAHRNLSNVKTYDLSDPQIKVMKELILDSNTKLEDKIALCYAMAKAYDDTKNYAEAFSYLRQANLEHARSLSFDLDKEQKEFSYIKNISVEKNPESKIDTDLVSLNHTPIFILGMPRSGTTLVEQILASHTHVFGAGELPFMHGISRSMIYNKEKKVISSGHTQLSFEDIKKIRKEYSKSLDSLRVKENLVTDKLPINFKWIELIINAFPESKIVHVERDPRATCWSIFKTFFSKGGNQYAYDMDHIVSFYNLYSDLMEYWKKRFDKKIYTINYENIINDQAEQTRLLLSFCNLEWQDKCMEFHDTERTVQTASQTQVRKKLYDKGLTSWNNYKPYINELMSRLN